VNPDLYKALTEHDWSAGRPDMRSRVEPRRIGDRRSLGVTVSTDDSRRSDVYRTCTVMLNDTGAHRLGGHGAEYEITVGGVASVMERGEGFMQAKVTSHDDVEAAFPDADRLYLAPRFEWEADVVGAVADMMYRCLAFLHDKV